MKRRIPPNKSTKQRVDEQDRHNPVEEVTKNPPPEPKPVTKSTKRRV